MSEDQPGPFEQERELVSPHELATWMRVSLQRLYQLEPQGIVVRVERGLFDLRESLGRYIEYLQRGNRGGKKFTEPEPEPPDDDSERLDKEHEQARLYRAKANIAEMDEAERAGRLHDGEAVAMVCNAMLADFRSRILAVPNAVAQIVADLSTAKECQEAVEAEIHGALSELSNWDPTRITGGLVQDDSLDGEASAETDPEPMGGQEEET